MKLESVDQMVSPDLLAQMDPVDLLVLVDLVENRERGDSLVRLC